MATKNSAKRADSFINKTSDKLLRAVGRFNYLSASQLVRLLYGKSDSLVEPNLNRLVAAEYLQCVPYTPPGRTTPGGRPRRVYTLDQLGYDYLRSLEVAPAGRFRPTERVKRQPSTLEHTLHANDLLILTHLLCKRHPEYQVERFETEAELKRHPVEISKKEPKVAVTPDAWVHLIQGEEEYGIAWELDRATENRTVFREKIRMLAYYCQGPYQQEFEIDWLTVAFVAAEGEKRRLDAMLDWTEAELSTLGAQDLARVFHFAAFNPETAAPEEVFLSPIWHQPFASELISLIEG